MVSPEVIEQEGDRILETYYNENEIVNSDNPSETFLNQTNKLDGLGIIDQLKENYTIANKMFKKLGIGSLKMKEFRRFGFGASRKLTKTQVLKGVASRTGIRQVISKRKGIIKSWEKWSDKQVRIIRRDKKGRFI